MPILTPDTPPRPIKLIPDAPQDQDKTDISGVSEMFPTPGGGGAVGDDTPETSRIEDQDDLTSRKATTFRQLGLTSPIYNLTISLSKNNYFPFDQNSTLELDGFYLRQDGKPVIVENKSFKGDPQISHTEHNSWAGTPGRLDLKAIKEWINKHGVGKLTRLKKFINNLQLAVHRDALLLNDDMFHLKENLYEELVVEKSNLELLRRNQKDKFSIKEGQKLGDIINLLKNPEFLPEIKFIDTVKMTDPARSIPFTRLEKLSILRQFLNPGLHYSFCFSTDVFSRTLVSDTMFETLYENHIDTTSLSFNFAVPGADENNRTPLPVRGLGLGTLTVCAWRAQSTPPAATEISSAVHGIGENDHIPLSKHGSAIGVLTIYTQQTPNPVTAGAEINSAIRGAPAGPDYSPIRPLRK